MQGGMENGFRIKQWSSPVSLMLQNRAPYLAVYGLPIPEGAQGGE